jgi:secreted PhoX family phosphatase
MNAIAVGKVLKKGDKDYDKYKDEYYCHPDYVANPDNIAYIGNDILLIGEDTGLHFNNMVFAYNTKEKTLTRIATLPSGGEVTGLENAFVKDKKVAFINTQHPFDDVCSAANTNSNCNSDILKNATHDDLRGFTGYIDGLPKDVF